MPWAGLAEHTSRTGKGGGNSKKPREKYKDASTMVGRAPVGTNSGAGDHSYTGPHETRHGGKRFEENPLENARCEPRDALVELTF